MSAALLLLAYTLVAATLGARILRTAGWVRRAPGWGVAAWQALSVSVAAALLLAGVAVAVPLLPVDSAINGLVDGSPGVVLEHYETPIGSWPGYLTLAATLAVSALLVFHLGHGLRVGASQRAGMLRQLEMVGDEHPDGFVVLASDRPLVYCVPGPQRAVVVTSGALGLLTSDELRLVLGHEDRHLRARHHLALAFSVALARTFAPIRLFSIAHDEVASLVEMTADDAARTPAERRSLARALVVLSTGTRPDHALAAGQTAAVQRVRRLTSAAPVRLGLWRGSLVGSAAVVLLGLPLGLAVAPAIEAATRDCCTQAVSTGYEPGQTFGAHPSNP